MRYKKMPGTDLELSVIGLDTQAIERTEEAEFLFTIEEALAHGVNFIVTSPMLADGSVETLIGKAIQGKRDKVVLATKCGSYQNSSGEVVSDLRPESVRRDIEGSLKRLGTDYIDIYLVSQPDPQTPLDMTYDVLTKLQAEGKFKYLGIANFDFSLTEKAAQLNEFHPDDYTFTNCVSQTYSLFNRENEFLSKASGGHAQGVIAAGADYYPSILSADFDKVKPLTDVLCEIAAKKGAIAIQVAVAWVTQQWFVTTALVHAVSVNEMRLIAKAGDLELTEEEMQKINAAYEGIFGHMDTDWTHGKRM